MDFLHLYFEIEDESLHVTAETESTEQSHQVDADLDTFIAHFSTVYSILEKLKHNRSGEFKQSITWLSQNILIPFSEIIQNSDAIRIYIDEEMIDWAIDLLVVADKPLALHAPITYILDDSDPDEYVEIECNEALIISDASADPERACKLVHDMLPNSEYYDIDEASLDLISEEGDDIDVLLISAHGELDEDYGGSISINSEELDDNQIKKVYTSLIYFDSCQMGINNDFLDVFIEEGVTDYYTAPIISNDAGDSSTKTLRWFFESLVQNGLPAMALFETKLKLYDFYSDADLNFITVINKVFPFRMYEFPPDE